MIFIADAKTWTFTSSVEGWSVSGSTATITPSADGLIVESLSNDPVVLSPYLGISGADCKYIKLRIKRVAGSVWDGGLFYSTPGHGFSESYKLNILPIPQAGVWTDYVLDMHNLTFGGDDWKNSFIETIRFDFGGSTSDIYIVGLLEIDYTPETDLYHSRIGIDNIVQGKTPTASSSATGYPAIAATYPTTYEYWKPSALPATWAIDNGAAVACDYFGLVGDFNGATINVQSSVDNSTWTTQATGAPTSRTAMFLFAPVSARYWRIQVTGAVPSIAVVYMGQALAMQRKIYQGHTPITLSRITETTQNTSETGQYLGRSIIRKGLQTSCEYQHLTADWYRANFDPFVDAARESPFFFAWRPIQYPNELGFVWTTGDIRPSNTGPRNFMSVTFRVTGIANE